MREFDPAVIAVRRDLASVAPGAHHNMTVFDAALDERGPAGFAVAKVGGGIVDDPSQLDHFAHSAGYLRRLGYPLVVVHGGGSQISRAYDEAGIESKFVDGLRVTPEEAIPVIEDVMEGVGKSLASRIRQYGAAAVPFSGIISATDLDRSSYGEVGRVINVDYRKIASIAASGTIPIISCLGRDEGGRTLNVNGDDAAAAVVESLAPLKYLAITPTGGVFDTFRGLIPYLTPSLRSEMENKGTLVLDGGMRKKVDEAFDLIAHRAVNDVVMVGPELIQELFTHEGYGTMLTAEAELASYEVSPGHDFPVSKQRLRKMIEDVFQASLPADYFETQNIAKIVITPQDYAGVGIFTQPDSEPLGKAKVLYMDKLAVAARARGRGVARQIIEDAAREHGLFWRAAPDNPYNSNYRDIADNYQRATGPDGSNWTVFWRNVPEHLVTDVVASAAQKPVTLHRGNG